MPSNDLNASPIPCRTETFTSRVPQLGQASCIATWLFDYGGALARQICLHVALELCDQRIANVPSTLNLQALDLDYWQQLARRGGDEDLVRRFEVGRK